MDLPGESTADVLAQPTRARLFAVLQGLGRRARTQELAERLGLHVNGVRRQLDHLRRAGLVERVTVPRGRGRPRQEWSVATGAEPGGKPPLAYSSLAKWLAQAIPAKPGRLREVERSGREIGRAMVTTGTEETADAFKQALAALGFQPEVEVEGDGVTSCRLLNCPYRDSVHANPAVVCSLHRGITTGILDRLAPDATLTAFEPRDPDEAGCLLEVTDSGWIATEGRA